MSFSRSNSIVFILLLLCLIPGSGSRAQQTQSFPADSLKPVFTKDFDKALYKGTTDIGKHHLSGLMMIKKFSDTSYRFVFNNEIGMKFLDLEFTAKSMIVHFCYPAMNRKDFLRILESDFRMLFYSMDGVKKIVPGKSHETGIHSFTVKNSHGKWKYSANDEYRLTRIRSCGKIAGKTDCTLKPSGRPFPGGFTLRNPTVGLTISMTVIGN